MEAVILQALGTASALIAALVSVRMLQRKLRSRSLLIERLAQNARFISELRAFQEAEADNNNELLQQEIDRLHILIQEQLSQLDESDRRRIESSLYQSSPTGRVRYIEKLASDASQLQHA
jgi:hypothetical protein